MPRPARSDRLSGDNPYGGMLFTERNFAIVDILREMADELERAHGASRRWPGCCRAPGVGTLLMGASRPEQVTANIAALQITLSPEQLARLDAASALPSLNPYFIFQLPREVLFGGQSVTLGETR